MVSRMKIYYPRMQFAQKIINYFSGDFYSFMLFEARRMGKTSFLKNDLIPLANKHYHIFYFSFMHKDGDVIQSFKEQLKMFLDIQILNKNASIKEIKSEHLQIQFNQAETLGEIFRQIKLFAKKPILFLFDEFQEVGRIKNKDASSDFVQLLRTVLDENRKLFKSIFTGSNLFDISNMFANYNQPLYRFGQQIKLPSLGEPFIDFLLAEFKKVNDIQLDKTMLLTQFNEYHQSPGLMTDLIFELDLNGSGYHYDIHQAAQNVQANNTYYMNNEDFSRLNKLDKSVLKRILVCHSRLTSEESLNWISDQCGQPVKRTNVTTCLSKLKSLNIIAKEKSSWYFLNKDIRYLIENGFE